MVHKSLIFVACHFQEAWQIKWSACLWVPKKSTQAKWCCIIQSYIQIQWDLHEPLEVSSSSKTSFLEDICKLTDWNGIILCVSLSLFFAQNFTLVLSCLPSLCFCPYLYKNSSVTKINPITLLYGTRIHRAAAIISCELHNSKIALKQQKSM